MSSLCEKATQPLRNHKFKMHDILIQTKKKKKNHSKLYAVIVYNLHHRYYNFYLNLNQNAHVVQQDGG